MSCPRNVTEGPTEGAGPAAAAAGLALSPTAPDMVFLRDLTNRYRFANKENIAPASPHALLRSSYAKMHITASRNECASADREGASRDSSPAMDFSTMKSPLSTRSPQLLSLTAPNTLSAATPKRKPFSTASTLDDSIASLVSLAKTPGHPFESPSKAAPRHATTLRFNVDPSSRTTPVPTTTAAAGINAGGGLVGSGVKSPGAVGASATPTASRQQRQQQMQLQAILAAAARLSGSPHRTKGSPALGKTLLSPDGSPAPHGSGSRTHSGIGLLPCGTVNVPGQSHDQGTAGDADAIYFGNLSGAAVATALNTSTGSESLGTPATDRNGGSSGVNFAGLQRSFEEILRSCGIAGAEEEAGDDAKAARPATTAAAALMDGAASCSSNRSSAKRSSQRELSAYLPQGVFAESDEDDEQSPSKVSAEGFANSNLAELWATLAAAGIDLGDGPVADRTTSAQASGDDAADVIGQPRSQYQPPSSFSVSAGDDFAEAAEQPYVMHGYTPMSGATHGAAPIGHAGLPPPTGMPLGFAPGGAVPATPTTATTDVNALLDEAFLAARRHHSHLLEAPMPCEGDARGAAGEVSGRRRGGSRTASPSPLPPADGYSVRGATAIPNTDAATAATAPGGHGGSGPGPRRTHFMHHVRAAAGSLIAVGGRRVPVTKLHLLHTEAEEGARELAPSSRRMPTTRVHTTVVGRAENAHQGATSNSPRYVPPSRSATAVRAVASATATHQTTAATTAMSTPSARYGSRNASPQAHSATASAALVGGMRSGWGEVSPLSATCDAGDGDGAFSRDDGRARPVQPPPGVALHERSGANRTESQNAQPSSRRMPSHTVHTRIRPSSSLPCGGNSASAPDLLHGHGRRPSLAGSASAAPRGTLTSATTAPPPHGQAREGDTVVTLRFAKGVTMRFYGNTAAGEALLRAEEQSTAEGISAQLPTSLPVGPSARRRRDATPSADATATPRSRAGSPSQDAHVLSIPVRPVVGRFYLARVLSSRSPFDRVGYLDVGLCVHVAAIAKGGAPENVCVNEPRELITGNGSATAPAGNAAVVASEGNSHAVDGVILRAFDIDHNADDKRQHLAWRDANRRAAAVCEQQFRFLNLPFQLDSVQFTRDMRVCAVSYVVAAAADTSSQPNVTRLVRDLQYELQCKVCLRSLPSRAPAA